jgi:hypothetical protein
MFHVGITKHCETRRSLAIIVAWAVTPATLVSGSPALAASICARVCDVTSSIS